MYCRHVILPIAREFNPDLVIVSAGFDAADGEPMGECHVTSEMFGYMTEMLASLGPIALLLEGGYNLSSTAHATEHAVRVLLGESPQPLRPAQQVWPRWALHQKS
jgi:histone deacetylase 6